MVTAKQMKYFAKLQKEDPEFYATILASKDLLDLPQNLNVDSDDEATDASADEESFDGGNADDLDEDDLYADEDHVETKKSQKGKQLQEESDEDDEAELPEPVRSGPRTVITSRHVKEWQQQLQSKSPEEAFRNVSSGLLAAIDSLNCNDDAATTKFSVTSPSMFNQLVHVSLQHMAPALLQLLHITHLSHITSSRKFKKYAPVIKTYLQNVLKLHDSITESSLREVILRRGVLPLIAVYKVQPKQCRQFIKKLVNIWSTGHTRTRVLAFLALFRLVKMMDADILDYTLKTMYLSYVQNCRFTSPSTLGCICFMRLSLSELYSLDQPLAYRHAFVYIRQMAFHLRNAIIANKKEKMQLVYNWQFIHCLHLWCTLLGATHPSKVLEPLIYPVVQLALGTMNLQKSPRFFPLVLQVCGMLTDLSATTNTFIPVLPFLINVFSEIKESKGKKKIKDKGGDAVEKTPKWSCVLKLSEGEVGVTAVMRSLLQEYALQITRYLTVESHSVAFPELVVPAVIMLKKCEKSKEAFGQSLGRQLLRHITDQASYVENKRQDVTFMMKDRKQLLDWETALKQETSLPIVKFYEKLRSDGESVWQEGSKKRKRDDQPAVTKKQKTTNTKKSLLSTEKVKKAQEKVEQLSLADLS